MKVSIELVNSRAKEVEANTKYFRVVTTEAHGMYCTEVFHQKGITRAFSRVHDMAVNNAVAKAVKYLKAS
jgi:hypothetical protein